MADEAGQGQQGAGGESAAPDAAALLKQTQELTAQLKQAQTEIQTRDAAVAQLMTENAMTRKQAEEAMQRAERRQEEPAQVDPITGLPVRKKKNKLKKKVKELQLSLQQEVENQRNQLDALHYQNVAADIPEDLQKMANATFTNWINQGIKIDKRKPTRGDALMFAAGKMSLDGMKKAKEEAEQRRREGLVDAQVELPGGGGMRRVAGVPEPEKLTRQERLEKYYTTILDAEGF